MVKPRGLDRQVHHVMRASVQLVANGRVKGLHEVDAKVVIAPRLAMLVQHGVVLTVIHRVPPTSAPTNPLQVKGEERWSQSSTYLFNAVQGSDQSMVPRIILAGEIIFFNQLMISLHVVWSCSVERMT